jgi:ribosomal protein L37AE/L43A
MLISLYRYRQLFPMEKQPQAQSKVKRDRPICEQCHDPNIVQRPDGSYKCKRCGYDSGKGAK